MSGASDAAIVPRSAVLADLIPGALVRDITLVGGYAGLIGLFAQLEFVLPFTPVPFTGQTFAVLLGALVLGTRRAGAGTVLYLALGVSGLPWFAGAASGLAIVSLGYIIGFVPAGALVGWLAERGWDRTPQRTAAAMVVGNLVIYAFGVPYLALALGTSLGEAVSLGAVPFVPGDLVKIAIATALVPAAWKLLGRRDTG